jgi:hypothetical protein
METPEFWSRVIFFFIKIIPELEDTPAGSSYSFNFFAGITPAHKKMSAGIPFYFLEDTLLSKRVPMVNILMLTSNFISYIKFIFLSLYASKS